MILVCGPQEDPSLTLVIARLRDSGSPYTLIDLNDYPFAYSMNWVWDGGLPGGSVSGPGWSLDLQDISGVYTRYGAISPGDSRYGLPMALQKAAQEEAQACLAVMLDQLPCLVVNRLDACWPNGSKPYQALAIRETGLRVPESLITTDPVAARAFCDACGGDVIIKPLSRFSAMVRRIQPQDYVRLESEPRRPIFLQRYVGGDNIRVHTVGDRLFATACKSNGVDYRYASAEGEPPTLEPTTLPEWVESACRMLSRSAGLVLAGIDLKRTPEGEYYCFEVNPSPMFAWYESQTSQEISAALAELLIAAH